MVFLNREILEAFLAKYYRENGFISDGGLVSRSYRKSVTVGQRVVQIEIDAAQIDQGPPFKEDVRLELPFTLLEGNSTVWKLEKEEVLIPTPELLLLQKVKAYRDRTWELGHTLLSPSQSLFLRGKVSKDSSDIRGIGPKIAAWSRVADLADRFACKALALETLTALGVPNEL